MHACRQGTCMAGKRVSRRNLPSYIHARRRTWQLRARRHRPSTAWPHRPARAGGAAATRARSGGSMRWPQRLPPTPRRRMRSGRSPGKGTPRTAEPAWTRAGPPAGAPARASCPMRRWRRLRRPTPSLRSATLPAWARSWAQVDAASCFLSCLTVGTLCSPQCLLFAAKVLPCSWVMAWCLPETCQHGEMVPGQQQCSGRRTRKSSCPGPGDGGAVCLTRRLQRRHAPRRRDRRRLERLGGAPAWLARQQQQHAGGRERAAQPGLPGLQRERSPKRRARARDLRQVRGL